MKQILLILSAFIAFLNDVKAADEPGTKLYSTRYDNLNINTILGSDRLVTNYVDCLVSRKPCPPEGKDLKRILPEALRTKCARCSLNQKEGALRVITKLYYSYPKHYNDLRAKWDSTGEYHRRFEEYLQDKQFNAIVNNDKEQVAPNYNKVQRVTTTLNNKNSIGRPTSPIPTRQPINTPITNPPLQVIRTNPPISLRRTTTSIPEVQTPRPARNPIQAIGLSALPNSFADTSSGTAGQSQPVADNTFNVANRFADEEIGNDYSSNSQIPSTSGSSTIIRRQQQQPQQPPQQQQQQPQQVISTKTTPTIRIASTKSPITTSSTAPATTKRSTRQQYTQNPSQLSTSQQQQQIIYTQPVYSSPKPLLKSFNRPTLIDHFFVPPIQQSSYQSGGNTPIVGLIHTIGDKISNTAEFFADMLRGTVKVIKAFKHVA